MRAAFPAAVILRPSIVFGTEDEFFNRFAAMARHLAGAARWSARETRFQPVYVDDVAAAAVLAATRRSPPASTSSAAPRRRASAS